nr:hypothetical protein [uncultured Fluviicola sp.]
MKKLAHIVICCFLVWGCTKENGKKPYDFALYFDSSDEWHYEWKIYEKPKKDNYGQEDLAYTMSLGSKNGIYLGEHRALYKTDSEKLMGTFFITQESTAIFSGSQSGNFEGYLTVEGSYKRHFREFIVEDGTFEFFWTNAEVYGMQDTVLKGKWTMKRK